MRLLLWISLVCLHTIVGAVTYLNGSYGFFESPDFPREYPNDVTKEWSIRVRDGYKIKYKFTSFDLEDSYDPDLGGSCVYDYVKVSEGGEEVQRLCGNPRIHHYYNTPRVNYWYYSKNASLDVEFVTDYSNGDISPTGFSAHYAEMDIDECELLGHLQRTTLEDWDELVTCNHFCINVPGSYYCDCRAGFELAPNKHTCVAKFCENQKRTAIEGIIESPEYPSPYGKLSNCQWDINVPEGFSIYVMFSQPFDIEIHDDEGCVYDKLTISYRDHVEDYCGVTAPHENRTWDLNTRDVRVQFQSDLSVERSGFQLIYNTSRIKCYGVLKPPTNGSITSSNPKGYYEYEDVVTFECDLGFDLIGQSHIECDSAGNWSHIEPTCKIISCGEPTNLTSVQHSEIIDRASKNFEYLEIVTVKCNDWYEQTQGYATWKCEHTKKWIPYPGSASVSAGADTPVCRPKCGVKGAEDNSLLSQQISGGTKSKQHEWPWTVFLNFGRVKNLGANGAMCGGALISPSFILTAAHCLFTPIGDRRWANHTHVWLGVPNRTVDDNEAKYVEVREITIHPKYNTGSRWNFDVALLWLSETIIMSATIRPICLPHKQNDFTMAQPNVTGEVAAWGLFDAGFRTSKFLLHAEFPIVTNEQCLASFHRKSKENNKSFPSDILITENMFCAGYEDGNQGTCQGDSGAPFVTTKKGTSIYFQLGLVSFGVEECGSTVSYTSFTKLNQAIVSWIMQTANNLE